MSSELEARSAQRQPMLNTELGQLARAYANGVWSTVMVWQRFAQDTVGRQWIRCADSVGANLVEGDGRGTEPDAVRFFVIARASLRESEYFLMLSEDRRLIDSASAESLRQQQDGLVRRINGLIKYRRNTPYSVVREETPAYAAGGKSQGVSNPYDSFDDAVDNSSTHSEL